MDLAKVLADKKEKQKYLESVDVKYDLNTLNSTVHMRFLLSSVESALSNLSNIKVTQKAQAILNATLNNKDVLCDDMIYGFSESNTKSTLFHYCAFHNLTKMFNFLACSMEERKFVKMMKEKQANGLTPLMIAVVTRNKEMVEEMAKLACFTSFSNEIGKQKYSALMIALLIQDLDIAIILAKANANASILSNGGLSALMLLMRLNPENKVKTNEMYKELIRVSKNIAAQKNMSCISYCIKVNNLHILKQLLRDKPNLVNLQNKNNGWTPLMAACCQENISLDNRILLIKLFIASGANLEAEDKAKRTALALFASKCNDNISAEEANIVKLLLEKGAKVESAFKEAMKRFKVPILDLLLDYSSDSISSFPLYEQAFNKYQNKYRYYGRTQMPRSFKLLDKIAEKSPDSPHWTNKSIYLNLLQLTSNNSCFNQKKLYYSLKHFNPSKKVALGEKNIQSITSLATEHNKPGMLKQILLRNIEDPESKISFEQKLTNAKRLKEHRFMNNQVVFCSYCRRNSKRAIYPGEPTAVRNDNNLEICCARCMFLPKNKITNLEYLKYKNKISEHNLAKGAKVLTQQKIPSHCLEALSNAKIENMVLFNKVIDSKKWNSIGVFS